MKNVALTILFLTTLVACDQRTVLPQGSGDGGRGPGPISPLTAPVVEGQETHGGDLAVAMLRSALMSTHHGNEDRTQVSKLMTMRATSESRGVAAPLYVEKAGLLEVNRDRVFGVDAAALAADALGKADSLGTPGTKVRPPYLGQTMTPALFKQVARDSFANLSTCMANAYSTSFLVPNMDFETVRKVTVEYATRPLYDSVTKRRVDVGVTLEETPRILIDRDRAAEWSVTNYATPYLVFHEYAHLLMKAYGRDDEDHVLASTLFYTCSLSSERFQLLR